MEQEALHDRHLEGKILKVKIVLSLVIFNSRAQCRRKRVKALHLSVGNGVQGITSTTSKFNLKSQAAKSLLKICKDVFVKFDISFKNLKRVITNATSYSQC